MPKPALLLLLLAVSFLACNNDQTIRVKFQLSDATFEQLKGKNCTSFMKKQD